MKSIWALLLFLWPVVSPAQYMAGFSVDAAVKYFRRMSVKPNAHKKEHHDQQLLLTLLNNIEKKEVEDLILSSAKALAGDEACQNCDLYLVAQFSKNHDVVNTGTEAFRTLTNSPERFLFYFDRLANFYYQLGYNGKSNFEKKIYFSVAAKLLVKSSVNKNDVRAEVEKKWLGFGPPSDLAESYFSIVDGKKVKQNFAALLKEPLNNGLSRIEAALNDKNNYDQIYTDTMLLSKAPQNPLVIAFLKQNIAELSLHQSQYNNGLLFLTALKSKDAELIKIAKDVIRLRTEGKDEKFSSADSGFPGHMGHDMMDREREMDGFNRDPSIGEGVPNWQLIKNRLSSDYYSHLQKVQQDPKYKAALHYYTVLSQTTYENEEYIHVLVDFLVQTISSFEVILPRVEYDAHSVQKNLRTLGELILQRKFGENYLNERRKGLNREIFANALRLIKNLPITPQKYQFYLDLASYLRDNSGNIELQKTFKENIHRLENAKEPADYSLIMSLLIYGNAELRQSAIRIIKNIINQQAKSADTLNQQLNNLFSFAANQFGFNQNGFNQFGMKQLSVEKQKEIIDLISDNFVRLPNAKDFFELCLKTNCSYPLNLYRDSYEKAFGSKQLEAILSLNPQPFNGAPQNFDWVNSLISEYQKAFKESVSGKFKPYEKKMSLRQLDQQFVKDADDIRLIKFLKNSIPNATLYTDHWNYRVFWVAAYGTGDKSLIDFVQHVLLERIRGHDYKFNRTLGKNLKTAEERFAFYFYELTAAASINPNDTTYLEITTTLVSSLGYELKFLRNTLEEILRTAGSEYQYRVALKIFSDVYGKEQVANVFTTPTTTTNSTKFVVVNGGYSEGSNFESSESIIKAFYYGIFRSNATVLNAGGPGSKSVALDNNGTPLQKDKDLSYSYRTDFSIPALDQRNGFPQRPVSEKFTPFTAATVDNLKSSLKEISKEKPKNVSLVLVGHGSQAGFAMWGKGFLNQLTLNDLYRNLFSETQVRTVVSSCYAGSMLANPTRIVPTSLVAFEKTYVTNQYPKNKCGFAMVNHFQLQYLNNSDWKNDPWMRIFEQAPHPSLEAIRNVYYPDGEAIPMLTSDYFLEDMRKTFCSEYALVHKSRTQYGENKDTWPKLIRSRFEQALIAHDVSVNWDKVAENVCTSEMAKRIDNFLKKGDENGRWAVEIMLRDRIWTSDLIKEHFPEIYSAAEANRLKNFPTFPQGWESNYLYGPLEVLYRQGVAHSQYTSFFNDKAKEYINQNKEKLKNYFEWAEIQLKQQPPPQPNQPPGFEVYALSSLENWRRTELSKLINENKTFYRQYLVDLPGLLEPLFSSPLFQTTKATYDSIKSCEASSLD